MSVAGSYTLSKFAVDAGREIERLQAQVDLFWPQEWRLYRSCGLKNGMRILDCGCGPGYLLEKLGGELPGLDCTGIDIDSKLVDTARQRLAASGLWRWVIHKQSITSMELPDGSFDFAVARLVLEHVASPQAAVNEVLRVLKPGGTVVFIDNDFAFHERTWPDSPSLEDLYAAYRNARQAEGGNPCIGRELPGLLQRGGFVEVELNALVAHNQIVGDKTFQKAEGAGIPAQLVRTGYLAPESLDKVTNEWLRALSTEDHAICRLLFAASGRKRAPDGLPNRAEEKAPRQVRSGDPLDCLTAGPPSREELMLFMREVLAAEMNTSPEEIPLETSLVAAGVDSLGALGLCNKLKSRCQAEVDISGVLSGKSIADLADDVLLQIKEHPISKSYRIPVQPRPAGL